MRLPLTLRLVFHGLRGMVLALGITLLGWVTLVPATVAERDALKAPIGTATPEGLVELRIARAMIHFAPDWSARLLSRASDGEISPELAGMLLRHMAAGAPDQAQQEPQTGGAKFILVE